MHTKYSTTQYYVFYMQTEAINIVRKQTIDITDILAIIVSVAI